MKKTKKQGWICQKTITSKKIHILLRTPNGGKLIPCSLPVNDFLVNLPLETFVEITPNGKLNVISKSDLPYTYGTLSQHLGRNNLDQRHLLLRDPFFISISNVKETVRDGIRKYAKLKGFREVEASILTKATEACEDISTLLFTDLFDGTRMALQQTAQLHLESIVYQSGRIWSLTPSFRNERARTHKHLIEYWHVEFEAVKYPLTKLMNLIEGLIKYTAKKVKSERKDELKYLGVPEDHLKRIIDKPFKRITYGEAIKYLQEIKFPISGGDDLNIQAEQLLAKDGPLFITHWPWKLKAFYMQKSSENPELANCVDLIGHGGHGEIVGGGERVYKLSDIKIQIAEQKKRVEIAGHDSRDYNWYISLRQHGSIPHSGFGMGLERLIKYLLNLDDVTLASFFPRVYGHCYP